MKITKIKHTLLLRCIKKIIYWRESLILNFSASSILYVNSIRKILPCKLLTLNENTRLENETFEVGRATEFRLPFPSRVQRLVLSQNLTREEPTSRSTRSGNLLLMNLSGRPRDNRFRNCANTGLEKRLGRGSIVRIVHSTRRFTVDPRRAHTRAIGIPETRITLIDRLMNRSPRIEFLFSVENVA